MGPLHVMEIAGKQDPILHSPPNAAHLFYIVGFHRNLSLEERVLLFLIFK